MRKHLTHREPAVLSEHENIIMNDLNGGLTMHETLTPNGSPEAHQAKKVLINSCYKDIKLVTSRFFHH